MPSSLDQLFNIGPTTAVKSTTVDVQTSLVPPAPFGVAYGTGYDGYFAELTVHDAITQEITFRTDKFLLTHLSETHDCRQAPVFVLTQTLMYTSGRVHSIGAYRGQFLINDRDGDSRSAFERDYHAYLKSDACLNRLDGTSGYVKLVYRDQVKRGYILSLDFTTSANAPGSVSFSFTMFLAG
jgi:hypothetical protein